MEKIRVYAIKREQGSRNAVSINDNYIRLFYFIQNIQCTEALMSGRKPKTEYNMYTNGKKIFNVRMKK